MRMRDIVLRQVYPPIPDRRWDWQAWHEGDEENNHAGWGATPEEAIADLGRLDEERAEANEPNPSTE